MSLITHDVALPYRRLDQALDCLLRPAVGFHSPFDVLKDPDLDVSEKRAILASWASDASAVEDRPTQRWLLGTDEPVPLSDVREALWRLDRWDDAPRLEASRKLSRQARRPACAPRRGRNR